MSAIVTVTEETLEQDVINADIPVLLDLWAPWCAPCRALAPSLDKLAGLATGGLKVAKLDVEKYPNAMTNFGVRGIPTLLLFRDGKEISREVGVKTVDQLVKWIASKGVDIERPTNPQPDAPKYPAFYGDQELKDFLFARLERHAEQGNIKASRAPFWIDGKGTPAAAMVHTTDVDVFERVAGLPNTFGLSMDFVQARSVECIQSLSSAIKVGADLSRVPSRLIYGFINEESFDWPNLLAGAPEADAFRCKWLKECNNYLHGHAVDDVVINDLKKQADELRKHSDRAVKLLSDLIYELCPMPGADKSDDWAAIFRTAAGLSFPIGQHQFGWTAEERATEMHRYLWFTEREAETASGTFTPEELETCKAQWNSENGPYQEKEAEFFKNELQGLKRVHSSMQGHLAEALKTAPRLFRV